MLRWLTYGQRFRRHYRHRRDYGYGRMDAFRSTRRRMRDPDA